MGINQKTTGKESSRKITVSNLIRWSGLAAMGAGITFVAIQPIHPADVLSSVTTSSWAVIMLFKTVMSILFVYGITGLYARQVEESGWLGLTGFLMFSLTWILQTAFIFIEAVILPILATAAPAFVESFLGIFNGSPGAMDMGALATVYSLAGIMYIFGGLLLGLATLRARILPRWPVVLLTVAAAMTPVAYLLSHPLNRIVAVPMGLAFVWLGYALWSEGRRKASESLFDQRTAKLEPSKAA